MEEKWYKKVSKLIQLKEKEDGIIYFQGYLCNLEPEGYMKDKLVLNLLGHKKELGYISDLIKVKDKDDFNALKEELDKINEVNFECTEDEFKLKIKTISTVKKEFYDYRALMTVYEVRADEYNAIRICEYENGAYKYEKQEGNYKNYGKTKLTFSNNMSYELVYLMNMSRLQLSDGEYEVLNVHKKQDKKIEKSIEQLFNHKVEEAIQNDEIELEIEIECDEIEIKSEVVDNNDKYKALSDYLAIKIAKHLYGLDWRLNENLMKLTQVDFVTNFKNDYPEDYERILKELLIESRCLIKQMSK